MKEKHTLNNLRRELQGMTTQQQKEKLKELQTALFVEWGRDKSHVMGPEENKTGPRTCWILRRCIAMVKTSLNEKGYHYNPRLRKGS